jgi:fibronectin type 3 domain-containing protein
VAFDHPRQLLIRSLEASVLEVKMLRLSIKGAIAAIAGLLIVLLSFVSIPVADAANVSIGVDGSQRFQTISALGADINPNSWDNGNLKVALDMLIDQEGMKTFRVGMDMIDWESTNDDSDPYTFNWDYYNPIYSGQTSFDTQYAGSNFANTWNVIDYLHQKGIPDSGIELSFMGPGPSWMGGSSLASGKEDEFVEEVLSAAYYGYSHGHTFGLFSPNNEMDISSNEGVTMSDTRYADILNRLAGRMNALGMGGVKILGPESCCTVGYANPMKTYPTLMANLAHFDFHNYIGDDNGAAAAVAGTGKDFWISEYANFDQTFAYLDQGAAGLQMWEAYDSVYNHAVVNGRGKDPGNDSLTFGDTPLIAYNKTTKVYTPRSEFYYFGQLFKWVPIGSQRISANSGNSNVKIEAFQDPATTRLTLVGENNSGSAQTLTIALNNLAVPSAFQYSQTNSGSHMAQGADVPVSAGSATVTVPANTTFTLTGLGIADTVAPTAPTNLTATGAVGSASLAWSAATDDVGVTQYNVYRSTTSGFTPSDTTKVGQPTTTSFTDNGLAAGTYYYVVTAQDAAGNASPPSGEVSATATADSNAPAASVTAPSNGSTVSGTVTVTASASDNVGVAGVQFRLDGANLGSEVITTPYTTSWDTTKVANGSHTLTAVARDAAGNITTSSAVTVTVANAVTGTRLLGLNSIQGSADSNAAGEAEAFEFTAIASGQAGTLTFYVDSGSAATTLKVGVYSDASGKPGTLVASGSLSAPRPAAWNTVTLGSNPAINSGTPYWIAVLGTGGRVNYRDTATGNCSQSNATTGLTSLPLTWSPGTPWPSCNLSAYVSATAADTTAPTVSISSPANNATVSGQTAVSVSANDNVGVSRVELYVDGALKNTLTSSPYSFTLDTATLTNATHQLTARAYDADGNVGTSAAVTVTVLNDTTAPTVPRDLSATASSMTSVSLSWTASTDDVAVAGYRVWRSGTRVATTDATNYTDTGLAPDTAYSYTVTALDAAGNESAQSATVVATTRGDTSPPTAPTGLTQTGATATTATLSWNVSDDNVGVAGYHYYDAGIQPLGSTTGTSHTYTGLGCGNTYVVGVDAYDAAGNLSAKATTTLTTAACDTQAPTVSITAPAGGASVSGTISVTASATDNVGVAGVQFKLDGANLGAEDATAPYTVLWNTSTAAAGNHSLTAVARDAAGNVSTSSPVAVVVNMTLPVTLDKRVTTHQSAKGRSITSPALTTAGAKELLVAFVSSDGPSKTGGQTFSSVTGGGLNWTLRKRVNTRYGTSEIWTAPASTVVTRITVTATRSSGGYVGSITVAAFQNASLTTVGATGGASATSGAPSASLTATKTGSVVWGVGDDPDRAAARTVGAGQALVDQFLATGPGATFWVQRLNSASTAGQIMTISDTAPNTDQWNLATIEIVPAG